MATMAATRQPFAPLNGSRLQNLTSLKNRQNALPTTLTSPIKRKAQTFESDIDSINNTENIDPIHFLSPKRSKNPDGSSSTKDFVKPTNFFLTKAPPSPNDFSSLKPNPIASPRRPILAARSPAPRVNTAISKSTPLSAPAGRSPTRKRIGILNRRKTSSPFTRVDPPKFGSVSSTSQSSLGFSIDAALSGTIPSYGARSRLSSTPTPAIKVPESLHEAETKESWVFSIYEDTEEELATNLMEHSTCTLDISSDEESRARMVDERGKENVAPADDISQTRFTGPSPLPSISDMDVVEGAEMSMSELKARIRSRRGRKAVDEGAIDIDRSPLGDLAAEDFYADGCDDSSVFIIPADESGEDTEHEEEVSVPMSFDFTADVKGKGREIVGDEEVEKLMMKNTYDVAPKAMLLQPMEKAEEGFEVWESGSAKDEGEDP